MPSLKPLTFDQHKDRWGKCTACKLCETRKSVVLLRGTYPARILFVGEAPGESEDVVGRPFMGPAGKQFDRILGLAGIRAGDFAATNLIACIPRDESMKKVSIPPKFAIDACADRLRECIRLVHPELVVWVGDEAKTHGPKLIEDYLTIHSPKQIHITHPGNLIRLNDVQRPLAVKRCVVALQTAVEELE